jgi:diguanylate cyclase (GGDEF)-like protein/PAS domain S-box-containing protein
VATSDEQRLKALRRRAEAVAKAYHAEVSRGDQTLSPAKAIKTLHELRVHQIELEMQNEELRSTQLQLDAERDRYFQLYDMAPVGYLSVSEKGLILQANLSAAQLLKGARINLAKQLFSNFIAPSDQDIYYLLRRKVIDTRQTQTCELQMKPKGSQPFWVRLTVNLEQDGDDDAAVEFRIVISDISERKKAEGSIRLAAKVFKHALEGIMITALDGSIIEVNDAFTTITGYSRDEVIGKNPRLLKSGRHSQEYYQQFWSQLTQQGSWIGENWNRRKNGEIYAQTQKISTARDAQGKPLQYVCLFSDITAAKNHEQELERIARYDSLTKLPNRALLGERLEQALNQTRRRGQHLAVVFIDLDGFKAVNDTHGHEAGDHLLITLAERMKGALRDGDILARLGGDEFVAVLLDLADVDASAPMLNRLLDAAARPFQFGQAGLQVSASLGVTFYPQAQDQEIEPDQLMRQADQAMYQAKQAGKNRFHVFDAEQDRNVRARHESMQSIERALSAGEFVLQYQPKVNLRTGEVIGVEALIRWLHPQQGLLPPADFLPMIEDHPLAVKLGQWVIESALAQMESWREVGLNMAVSINIGRRHLMQTDFVQRLGEALAAHPGLQPNCLELELLEANAVNDLDRVAKVIQECRAIGVECALDDFGSGYSSLTGLKKLPVKYLKIEQNFIRDMLDSSDSLLILIGVLKLASAFDLKVIAEGVETAQHGSMLLELGCELAQGFGIARPMPADDLPRWVHNWKR